MVIVYLNRDERKQLELNVLLYQPKQQTRVRV
jgi:hypothetical protein